MASKRTRTIWLIALLVPVLLVTAGIVTLKLVFTGERLKAMVVPRLEQATGREVSIADIGLSILPLGVAIDSLSISNPQGKGFSREPLLSLERLRLHVRLFPLLAGDITVTSLYLERPRLLLEVNRQNVGNYSGLGGGDTPGGGSAPAALSLVISKLAVQDGMLAYVNRNTESATRLRALTIDAALDTDAGMLVLEGSAATDSLSYGSPEEPMIEGLAAALDFRIRYDPGADRLSFEEGALSVEAIPLTLSGTITGLRAAPTLDLALGADRVSIPALVSLAPAQASQVSGTGSAEVRIAITGVVTDTTEAEIRGRVATRQATLQYEGLEQPITDITLRAGFTRTATVQEFRVDTMTARLGDAPIGLSLRVEDFENPRLALAASGKLDLGRLRDYYPLEQGTELGGTMDARIRVSGPPREPTRLRASGTMRFTEVSVATPGTPSPLRRLNGSIAFNDRTVESKRLSFLLGESDLALGFRLTDYLSMVMDLEDAPRPSATMTVESRLLRSEDFMAEETDGRPDDPQPGAAARSGLPFPDIPVEMTLSIGTLTVDKFDFRNVRGAARMEGGVLRLQNLSLNAFGGSVRSGGSLDLRAPERSAFDLSLDMDALQAGQMLTPFTSFGQHLGGALSMETSMAGALNDTLGLIPATLDGTGNVTIADGVLRGFRVNEVVASTFNIPELRTVEFRDWKTSFTVKDGRVLLKNLVVRAANAEYVVNGSHGLDGTIDYRMELYLPPGMSSRITLPGFAGQAIDLFRDQSGRLRFDLNVGGTVTSPTLQLDTEAVQKKAEQMADEKLKKEMEKLEETVKDKAGDVLKKLFKPPR